jgi:hypothetical protein
MEKEGVSVDDPSKIDRSDPKFQKALESCREFLPAGAGQGSP